MLTARIPWTMSRARSTSSRSIGSTSSTTSRIVLRRGPDGVAPVDGDVPVEDLLEHFRVGDEHLAVCDRLARSNRRGRPPCWGARPPPGTSGCWSPRRSGGFGPWYPPSIFLQHRLDVPSGERMRGRPPRMDTQLARQRRDDTPRQGPRAAHRAPTRPWSGAVASPVAGSRPARPRRGAPGVACSWP